MSRRPFVLEFTGRAAGALGTFYPIVAIREAETLAEAELSLYDNFEHINGCHESTRYGVRDGRLYLLQDGREAADAPAS